MPKFMNHSRRQYRKILSPHVTFDSHAVGPPFRWVQTLVPQPRGPLTRPLTLDPSFWVCPRCPHSWPGGIKQLCSPSGGEGCRTWEDCSHRSSTHGCSWSEPSASLASPVLLPTSFTGNWAPRPLCPSHPCLCSPLSPLP